MRLLFLSRLRLLFLSRLRLLLFSRLGYFSRLRLICFSRHPCKPQPCRAQYKAPDMDRRPCRPERAFVPSRGNSAGDELWEVPAEQENPVGWNQWRVWPVIELPLRDLLWFRRVWWVPGPLSIMFVSYGSSPSPFAGYVSPSLAEVQISRPCRAPIAVRTSLG